MKKLLCNYKWPLVIFLAAFLVRLVYLIQFQSSPSFYYPMVDELWHLNWAKEIISGNFCGDEAYFRGPLYPYILALFLKITNSSIFWSRILQIMIGSLSAVMVYLLGKRFFSTIVGITAGLAYSIYGTIVFYEALFLIPVIYIFLSLMAVFLLVKCEGQDRPWPWLLAGVVLGLSAIARPNILLLAPFFILWLYLIGEQTKNFRKRIILPLIYLLGILIPVFSVTLRNYIVTNEVILISSQGGINFYLGNNPDTEGLTMLMPEVQINETLPWSEFTTATRQAAETEAGKALTAGEESSFWTRKALRFIINNPGGFVATTFKKTVYFMVGFENSDNADIYYGRNYSSLFSILLWEKPIFFPFGLLLPLSIIGLAIGWKRKKDLALLYIIIIGYLPTVVLFLVTARHRLPVVPFMILFAAYGTISLIKYYKDRNRKNLWLYLLIFIVILFFSNRTYFDIGFQNLSQIHFNQALAYERQGDLVKAEIEYLEALKENPYSSTILNNLGYAQYRLEKYDLALSSFRKAIKSDPDYARAYNNAGLVFEAQKNYAEAEKFYVKAINIDPNLYQSYINLGDIYLAQKDLNKAELSHIQATQISPENSLAYLKLGALYGRKKDYSRAEEMFNEGYRLAGEELSASHYLNWGNIYLETKQPTRAIELYKKAITKDPALTQAYLNLAITFKNFGYPDDSTRTYLKKLLGINPNHETARRLLLQTGP